MLEPMIEVRDCEGNVVAPRPVVNWNSNMTSSNVREMEYLKHKKKAVAWIVNKCETKNERMTNAKRLQRLFRANALDFDMYGCGNLVCPKEGCLNALKRDYYFCYAPEDSDGNDYVTSEIVTGYNSYAVPIVKGGAD
ncbi:jg6154 [Pararge aegeria aegeria]|uniref:Fucosyltransferase n=1 Tax=Pararge aegeria aegeria TaxID=348720 RepID=A0A8S4RFD2_9NEOP|nr:jg6154 [Pararge aegeria aegeria]